MQQFKKKFQVELVQLKAYFPTAHISHPIDLMLLVSYFDNLNL